MEEANVVYSCAKDRREVNVSYGAGYERDAPACPSCKKPMKEGPING